MAVNKTRILSSVTCGNEIAGTTLLVVRVGVDTHACKKEDDAWILSSAFLGWNDEHVCAQAQKTTGFKYDESDSFAECDYECRFEIPSASWQRAMADADNLRLSLVEYTKAGDVTDWEFVRDKMFPEKCSWALPKDTINVPSYVGEAVEKLRAELKFKKGTAVCCAGE